VGIGINLKNIDPVNDQGLYVLVEKIECADAQCDQREAFKSLKTAMSRRPRPCALWLVIFQGSIVYQEASTRLLVVAKRAISSRFTRKIGWEAACGQDGFLAPFFFNRGQSSARDPNFGPWQRKTGSSRSNA